MVTVLEKFNEQEAETMARYMETGEFVPSHKRGYSCEAVCPEHHTSCEVSGSMEMQGLAHVRGKHACVTMAVNHQYDDYEFTPERVTSDRKLSHQFLFGDRYTKGGQ